MSAGRQLHRAAGALIDGTYRVTEAIGAGGMGEVYRALDERLQREVAIKFIRADRLTLPRAHARFVEEARAMARVHHPHVVEVHAFGTVEDTPYFVMQYVQGADLSTLLRQSEGHLPLRDAHRILVQLCRGLEAIHASGTVHRDLKASNVLIDPAGNALISDLGLARLAGTPRDPDGTVSGTLAYMAPEMLSGEHAAREHSVVADVYALAVIAYELLVGTRPFAAASTMHLAWKQISEAPRPLRALRPELPIAYERAVLDALEKDPAQRTRSAEALRTALTSARRSSGHAALRVLLVDDDPELLALLASTLARAFPGVIVDTAHDGLADVIPNRARWFECRARRPPYAAPLSSSRRRSHASAWSWRTRSRERPIDAPRARSVGGVSETSRWRTMRRSRGAS